MEIDNPQEPFFFIIVYSLKDINKLFVLFKLVIEKKTTLMNYMIFLAFKAKWMTVKNDKLYIGSNGNGKKKF